MEIKINENEQLSPFEYEPVSCDFETSNIETITLPELNLYRFEVYTCFNSNEVEILNYLERGKDEKQAKNNLFETLIDDFSRWGYPITVEENKYIFSITWDFDNIQTFMIN